MSWTTPVSTYLRLRLRLLGRLLREVGWLRLTLVVPMLALLLMQALETAARQPVGRWAVPVALAATLLSGHRQRGDYQFLQLAAPGFRTWLAVEYALASLPVALLLALLGAWGAAAFTPPLATVVAWAPPARQALATRHRWRSLFRSEAFEWVSGMRASYGLLLWPVLLAGAAWQRASPLGPIAALLGWLLAVAGCYGTPEPATMLLLAVRTPRQLLRRRLALGLGYAATMALPFAVLLALGPAGWVGAGAVLLFWLVLLTMVVLAKYAFYPNATHVRTTQALVLALGLLGAWHPAYPPLMLVILGGLIWQSNRRLQDAVGPEIL